MTMEFPFSKVLVANRGEIACRVFRTCRKLGLGTVAVYSTVDAGALHTSQADEAVFIGGASAVDSYLNIEKIISAAKDAGAQAIHPGYGFLSENAEFAAAVSKAGLIFLGPKPETISLLGDKIASKELAEKHKLPLLKSLSIDTKDSEKTIKATAEKVGYPLLVKAAAGGGGRGMRVVHDPKDLLSSIESASREASSAFGDGRVFLEQYADCARHVEVQVFGDTKGNAITLYDRDCSLQRRHQKVVEEAPAPDLPDSLREAMYTASINLAKAADYIGAGTVEFLVDRKNNFYFLEMNSRLQVEHPVTECICDMDLVELQLKIAAGYDLNEIGEISKPIGHAIEVRLCAEVPEDGFRVATGGIDQFEIGRKPANVKHSLRVDTGFAAGSVVQHYYDSMLAKIVVHGDSRADACAALRHYLDTAMLTGVETNLNFLKELIERDDFISVSHSIQSISNTEQNIAEGRDLELAGIALLHSTLNNSLEPAWSNSPFGSIESKYIFQGKEIAINVSQASEMEFTLKGEGLERQVLVSHSSESQLGYNIGGQSFEAEIRKLGIDTWLRCHHGLWKLTEVRNVPSSTTSQQEQEGELRSELPGKIISILVSESAEVSVGTPVVLIESMKMEHQLTAPTDGVVSSIPIAEGELVEANAVLMEFDKA